MAKLFYKKAVFKCVLCGKEGIYSLAEDKVGICSSCRLQTSRFERYETVEKEIVNTKKKVLPKHFFDITSGKEIAYSDVDKICKENGLVYGGDEEITKECERNKSYHEAMMSQRIERELYPSIMERL